MAIMHDSRGHRVATWTIETPFRHTSNSLFQRTRATMGHQPTTDSAIADAEQLRNSKEVLKRECRHADRTNVLLAPGGPRNIGVI